VADSLRSIDLILAEVRIEREGQLKHFDALDSKAGVILGFAGAIVAITRTGGHVLVNPGRLLAITSGLLAIWALAEEVLVHGSEIFPGPLPHFGPRIHQAQAHGHADIDDRIDG